jgi:predicted RNA-binding protein Jag
VYLRSQSIRNYSSRSPADELIEELTELYGIARDEFEIATEETEKKSVYAASDREAARDELARLKTRYEEVLQGEHGEEVRRRIGARLRELENAVEHLNKADYED